MQQIDNLTDAADQLLTFVLGDGSVATFEFVYRPAIQRWSLNIDHPALTVNGLNLAVHPNLLRQWRNVAPFGLAVTTATGADPMGVTDFLTGNAVVCVLSAAEVAQVESELYAPIALVNP